MCVQKEDEHSIIGLNTYIVILYCCIVNGGLDSTIQHTDLHKKNKHY